MYVCVCVCIQMPHLFICVYAHACMYVYKHVCENSPICTYWCTYTDTCIHVRTSILVWFPCAHVRLRQTQTFTALLRTCDRSLMCMCAHISHMQTIVGPSCMAVERIYMTVMMRWNVHGGQNFAGIHNFAGILSTFVTCWRDLWVWLAHKKKILVSYYIIRHVQAWNHVMVDWCLWVIWNTESHSNFDDVECTRTAHSMYAGILFIRIGFDCDMYFRVYEGSRAVLLLFKDVGMIRAWPAHAPCALASWNFARVHIFIQMRRHSFAQSLKANSRHRGGDTERVMSDRT